MLRLTALALLTACSTLWMEGAAAAAPPAPGSWAQLPGTALSGVFWRDPAGKHVGDLVGAGRPENIVRAWSGAAYDTGTDRLIIAAAGGHGDYAGYEVYVFTLLDLGSGKWTREIDPVPSAITPYQAPPTNAYTLPNGDRVPASRHTYNGLVYLPPPHGKVLLIGGARWWDGNGAKDAWLYDIAAKTWAPSVSPVPSDAGDLGINSAWDSAQRRVLYQTYARLRAFDPSAPATSTHAAVDEGQQRSDSANRFMTALYDTGRKRYVMAGPGGIEYYDVGGPPPYKRKRLALTGAAWPGPYAPGFDCGDASCSRYAVWAGRSTIHFVDGGTGAVTAEVGAGPVPPAPEPNGTFGRFRYSPRLGGFVLVSGPFDNVWVYRPKVADASAAVATPPGPPTAGPMTIPTRTFVALDGPEDGKGIPVKFGMKHLTGAIHPPSGRIYFIGGDYRSRAHADGSQSYNQEVWSLSVADRWAGGSDSAAGWRLEVPYCKLTVPAAVVGESRGNR